MEKEIPAQGDCKFSRFCIQTLQRASAEGRNRKTIPGVVARVLDTEVILSFKAIFHLKADQGVFSTHFFSGQLLGGTNMKSLGLTKIMVTTY